MGSFIIGENDHVSPGEVTVHSAIWPDDEEEDSEEEFISDDEEDYTQNEKLTTLKARGKR